MEFYYTVSLGVAVEEREASPHFPEKGDLSRRFQKNHYTYPIWMVEKGYGNL